RVRAVGSTPADAQEEEAAATSPEIRQQGDHALDRFLIELREDLRRLGNELRRVCHYSVPFSAPLSDRGSGSARPFSLPGRGGRCRTINGCFEERAIPPGCPLNGGDPGAHAPWAPAGCLSAWHLPLGATARQASDAPRRGC